MAHRQLIEQAHVHLRSGNLPAAEAICADILASAANDGEALNLRAMIAQQRGDMPLAVRLYQKAITAQPDAAGYRNNLGVALHAVGRIAEAVDAYHQGVRLNPKSAQIHFNLGNTLRELGQLDEAAAAIRHAISLRGDAAEFHYALGLVLAAAGQFEQAAGAYRAAIGIKDEFVDAWMSLGNAMREQGNLDGALEAHRKAIALRPNYAEAHNNLALSLYDAGDLQASIAEFRQASVLRPDFASAWSNLANVLRDACQTEEAIAAYRRAIAIQVDHVDARKNLSLMLLQTGDYANGFLEYEWRFKVPGTLVRKFDRPRWAGQDIAGKTIFIHEEQGFGDVIQFARYAGVLHRRGAKVIFGCRPDLVRLITGCDGVASVVTGGQTVPRFDVHCPLMSLPLLCQTTAPENVPADVPYFHLNDEITRPWQERLPDGSTKRVGLCWAGNPELRSDRIRSIALQCFAPLANVGDIEFHSLQFGIPAGQIPSVPEMKLKEHLSEIRDFADTAALISRLDLVIAVDTAVAHLAGAMAKPVWILLPPAVDWRWLMRRSDSPWYPTARLFRQQTNWPQVIDAVGVALREWAMQPRTR